MNQTQLLSVQHHKKFSLVHAYSLTWIGRELRSAGMIDRSVNDDADGGELRSFKSFYREKQIESVNIDLLHA